MHYARKKGWYSINYYIAIMETIDATKDKEIRTEHIGYLNDLIHAGKILSKGPFTDGSSGLIIFAVDSYEEAQSLANSDPASQVGSRRFVVREWKSSLELKKALDRTI